LLVVIPREIMRTVRTGESESLSRGARTRLSGWALTVRIAALVMMWLVMVPCIAVVMALYGVLGAVAAWRVTAVVFLPLFPLTWLLVRRMRQRRRMLLLAGALVVGLVFGLPAWATPGPERLARAESEVAGPEGGVLIGRDFEGDDWCWQGCPKRLRYYAVPDAVRAVGKMESWAQEHGWERATLDQGGIDGGWCRGDFSLLVHEATGPYAKPVFPIREAPTGTETVIVPVGANCR